MAALEPADLARPRESIWRRVVLSLMVMAAAFCLYNGITSPIIKLTQLYVFSDEHSLASAVLALYYDGEYFLAGIILVFSIVMPTVKLLYLLVLAALPDAELGERKHILARLEWVGKWSMHDVLILSLSIVYLRASGISDAASMPGSRFFAVAVILIMLSYGWIKRTAYQAAGERGPVRAETGLPPAGLSGARRFLIGLITIASAVALGLGVTLPVIKLTKLYLWTDEHSILSAIYALTEESEWFLASIIFLFSVLFPAAKLFYLLIVSTLGTRRPEMRERMLDRLEWLGKWSMMDVLVLALVVFYVNASAIADASALPGIYFFSASVFLTMVAYALVKSGLRRQAAAAQT